VTNLTVYGLQPVNAVDALEEWRAIEMNNALTEKLK
jgi:hypothetical protein